MLVPWKVLQNQQSWQPHSFDLIGLAGQTFAVYFNVINDGVGGRTAMWVDDARLWACSGGAYPPPMPPMAVPLPAVAAASAPLPAVAAVQLAAVATLAPTLAALPAPVAAAALAASTPSANITRVAVVPPTQTFTGTAVAPRTEVLDAASSWWSRIKLQEVLRWFLIASAIVGIFLVLLWLLRKLFGSPKPNP